MSKKLSASKVAQHLDISVTTLTNWYKWQNSLTEPVSENAPRLPQYEQHSVRGPRFWTEEQLKELEVFKEWIPRGRNGVMGNINARYWGARGKRALKNKDDSALTNQD